MSLTAREILAAKAKPKPYGLADGDGLFLWVTPAEQKYWHFRYRLNGKQQRISLGVHPVVSLQLARRRAVKCRTLVAQGIHPRLKRKQNKRQTIESQANTFKVAAEDWYERKTKAGRSESTLNKMRAYLDKDILPVLGRVHSSQI